MWQPGMVHSSTRVVRFVPEGFGLEFLAPVMLEPDSAVVRRRFAAAYAPISTEWSV